MRDHIEIKKGKNSEYAGYYEKTDHCLILNAQKKFQCLSSIWSSPLSAQIQIPSSDSVYHGENHAVSS